MELSESNKNFAKPEDVWVNTANDFHRRTQFPNCMCAVDAKHVRIWMPSGSRALFYNYKHFFSVLLLGLADADCCFITLVIVATAKSGDSSILKIQTQKANWSW